MNKPIETEIMVVTEAMAFLEKYIDDFNLNTAYRSEKIKLINSNLKAIKESLENELEAMGERR